MPSLPQKQESSRGNKCCTARSIHDVPTRNFAALTMPSRPFRRSLPTPIFHLPQFLSSDLISKTSPTLGCRSSPECLVDHITESWELRLATARHPPYNPRVGCSLQLLHREPLPPVQNQIFSNFRGHSSKIDFAHILSSCSLLCL